MSDILKQTKSVINVTSQGRTVLQPVSSNFFSYDVEVAKKYIEFRLDGKEIDLNDASNVICMMYFDSAGKVAQWDLKDDSDRVQIEHAKLGLISLMLPNYLYDYQGEVYIYFYIDFKSGQSLDAGMVQTRFTKSAIQQQLPEMEKFYVQRFEDLASLVQAKVDDIGELTENAEELITSIDRLEEVLSNIDEDFVIETVNHMENSVIHVTEEDRINWDGKVSEGAVYNKADIDGKLSGYLSLTGGTLTGGLTAGGTFTSTNSGVGFRLKDGNDNGFRLDLISNGANPRIRLEGAGATAFTVADNAGLSIADFTSTAIRLRKDVSATGPITSPNFIGPLSGNADTATRLQTARNFQITGAVEGTTSSDLNGGVVINTAQRRLQITNWGTINPRTLNLRRGDTIAIWGDGNATNQPLGTTGLAWAGELLCVNDSTASRYIATVWTNHRVGAKAHFTGGAWTPWDTIPIGSQSSDLVTADELMTHQDELQECREDLQECQNEIAELKAIVEELKKKVI